MSEVKYALEAGLKIDVKDMGQDVRCSWKSTPEREKFDCTEYISHKEAQELGLIAEEKTEEQLLQEWSGVITIEKPAVKSFKDSGAKLIIGHGRFENVLPHEFMSRVHEVINDDIRYDGIHYGAQFDSKEAADYFISCLPKSMRTRYNPLIAPYKIEWYTNIVTDGLFENKNVQKRIEKVLSILRKEFWK